MGEKKFTTIALDLEHKIYIVYVGLVSFITLPSSSSLNIYPSHRPQISSLIAEKTFTKVPNKYIDFANVFTSNLTSELPEYTGINKHVIKLIDDQQSPYGPFYSLEPVELETLKVYIKTNPVNKFIRLSKSAADVPILFDRKLDSFFQLCVNYWDLNNLMIKNWYPWPLIGELLNRLKKAKRFTQLNFTSAYYCIKIRKRDKWKSTFRTQYGHFE